MNSSCHEVEEVFKIEAENIERAEKSLSTAISEMALDVISREYSVENREGEPSIYNFTVKHYVGPKQQRKPFDPRALKG